MKYYFSPKNYLYAYPLDGSQDEHIPADFVPATAAQVQAMQNPAPTPEQVKSAAIDALEASITPRRMREAVLGIDGGWLANVEKQIATLRS